MSFRMYLALKMSDSLGDLVVSIVDAFLLWAEMDPANRECLTSQAVRGI